MAMASMRGGIPRLFKEGYKQFTGLEEAILKNIEACVDLADMTATSFGPSGMNKIVINHIEKIFVTSDAATIMNELQVQHPAAKVIVLAAQMQEKEIGDGTNFVLMFAGELLKKATDLIHMGVHPSDIIRGYEIAAVKADELIADLTFYELQDIRNKEKLVESIRTAIASKQFGIEDKISDLVADACLTVMPKAGKYFAVDNVRVLKLLGGDVSQSRVVRGLALISKPLSSVREVKNAKVAIFTCAVAATQTETKGTVLMESAVDLLSYSKSEEDHMENIIKTYKEMGVELLISGEKFSDMACHFMNKYKIMGVKSISKFTIRRMCRLTGARPCVTLQARQEDLGFISRAYTEEMGEKLVTVLQQGANTKSAVSTIILRGATNNLINDMERAIDDGVNVVRALIKDNRFVPGAGAAEIELARQMEQFASKNTGLEQYAIRKYAQALEVVPRMLATNSGLNGNKVVADLYAAHEKGDAKIGVDLSDEKTDTADMTKQGVFDLLATRKKGLQLSCKAAITILRVDHIIMRKPAGGPKKPKNRGHWDDNDAW